MIQVFIRFGDDFGCSSQMVGYISKNSCFSFGQPMIHINSRIDERVAQCFPNDPYSNLCIVTATQKLYLQHAFLSMDSAYFSRIDPDASQVKLLQLQQIPLLKVLHALYGAPLVAEGFEELDSLLHVIHYLEIQQYRRNIEEAIRGQQEMLGSVEFVEVSHKYQLLWEDVVEFHVGNGLEVLANERAFLQLGKVSQEAFRSLMAAYAKEKGGDGQRMLNRAMENYFNRKGIRPMVFLAQSNLPFLRAIWMNHHHVSQPEPVKQVNKRNLLLQKQIFLGELQQANEKADRQIQNLTLKIALLRQDLCLLSPTARSSQLLQTQTQLPIQLPLSLCRTQTSLQKGSSYSSNFIQYIEASKNPEKSTGKILKRFGAKNLKRWT